MRLGLGGAQVVLAYTEEALVLADLRCGDGGKEQRRISWL
jgi:hypothetical protein